MIKAEGYSRTVQLKSFSFLLNLPTTKKITGVKRFVWVCVMCTCVSDQCLEGCTCRKGWERVCAWRAPRQY